MTSERYDVAIIGGGPGGYVAGIRLGQHGKKAVVIEMLLLDDYGLLARVPFGRHGKKAVVIEKEHLGGICLNWGCIPSKAIIHAANVRHEVEAFAGVFDR